MAFQRNPVDHPQSRPSTRLQTSANANAVARGSPSAPRLPEVDRIGTGRATGSRSSRSLVDRTRGWRWRVMLHEGQAQNTPPSWTASSAGIIMRGMPPDLPNGVVTLLFTDIEGSTKLLREIGDAYTEALHEHRRVLRSAFAAHHGVEI